MLITCYVQILALQKPHIHASFNINLVISKCVTAVIHSDISGHYIRNRSNLVIGVLGYIGIVNIRNILPKFGTFLLGHPAYRVSQEECARLREGVPYVKVYRYNSKHLCPKLNGYGDNGQRSLKL